MFSQTVGATPRSQETARTPGRANTMATESYDAIVVGGGHNGLVAAAYLAKSGAKTLVLEARGQTGGAATTEAPWPDAPEFKVTRLSYVMSLLPPTIMRDLELEKHGYKVFPMGPYYQAFPEGGSLTLYEEDSQRSHDEIARWSKKDADAYPKWEAWLAGLADVLGPLLLTVPPAIGSRKPKDLAATLRLAWRHPGPHVRPGAAGTRPACVMAHHSIGDVGDGRLGSWGFPEGGMGAVAAAIARSATANGATIRTGAKVARVLVSNGRATGVVPDTGEEIRAATVVSSLHPKTAFLDHVGKENLPASFAADIEHWKTRSGVVKINLALAELPDFTANPGTHLQEHHTGSVEMAPTMEYIEKAFIEAREGRPATRPFSDGVIPTAFDKTLCPDGYHIIPLFTPWAPADWSQEPHRDELEKYADRMIDVYNADAPKFKSAIIHRDVVGPYEMEHDYGLIGGNIFHVELSLEQRRSA